MGSKRKGVEPMFDPVSEFSNDVCSNKRCNFMAPDEGFRDKINDPTQRDSSLLWAWIFIYSRIKPYE